MPNPRLSVSPRARLVPWTVAAALAAGCGARQGEPADLGVTRVVLYQSGIAYIEREGSVAGSELVMPIRPDQVNDILATMVVVDRSGSGGTSVSLPLDESAGDRMADLPPELRDAGGMVAVLAAFRGADVSVRVGQDRTRGRIVGVEVIDGAPHATLLTTGDTLVPIPVSDIESVDLRSESLSLGLNRSLDHSLAAGDWKPTDVTIRFGREGNHDVTLAYVVEMPIWKPAYRVIVEDDELLLQGWAVIDNTSGVDWTDVRLSLTAGSPLSFRYDLHAPIYIDRPDMSGYGTVSIDQLRPPEPIAAQRSRAAGGGAGRGPSQMPAAAAPMYDMDEVTAWGVGGAEGTAGIAAFGSAEAWAMDDYSGSLGASATVGEVASLFRFDIPGRVTLPDQSSTMVTLINSEIGGENALVYQPDAGTAAAATHPYRALLLDNDTRYPIQPAPVAIYDSGTFVGQGITPTIAPGESAVISYALESRVSVVQSTSSNTGSVKLVAVADGLVHIETQYVQGTEYAVESSMDDAISLYLKVPRYDGYALVDNADVDPDDVQAEAGYYLVPAELEGRSDRTITVEQVTSATQQVDVLNPATRDAFALYLSSSDARPDVSARIRPIQEKLDELRTVERLYSDKVQLRSDIQARTNELRQNIRTLGESEANADLRRTLVDRLADQDAQLERLNGDIVALSERASVLRIEAAEALRELRLEGL